MMAVQAYYDGVHIKPLEPISVKRNQKIILTIRDEYVDEEQTLAPVATASMQAFNNLQKYRKQGDKLTDYRQELTDILGERHESLD